jgi:hypothetical protein
MKTLIDAGNGIAVLSESDGPPLEHDEWVEEQNREHERQRKELEGQQKSRPQSRRAAADDEGEEEEPAFRGHKLSEFDGIPDDQLAGSKDGIGAGTAEQIVAARKKRDRRANR